MNLQEDQAWPAPNPAPPTADPTPQPQPNGTRDSSEDLDTLRAELNEITQKADEYLRLAQRTQADFINYRRRVEDEKLQQAQAANIGYILRVLPILDDFERALANATPQDLESNWGKGILLVERNMRGLLAGDGVERIVAEGAEFDPREHEALGRQPTPELAEGHVLHVVRPGYRKGERVIRPAQVIVASAPEAQS